MIEEHTQTQQGDIGDEVDIFEEYESILHEYKRREMMRNLTGIGISVLFHVFLILIGFYVIVIDQPQSEASITAETVEMEIKEIPPQQLDEFDKSEYEADIPVPTVSRHEPSNDSEETVDDIPTDMASVDAPINVDQGWDTPLDTSVISNTTPGTRGEEERQDAIDDLGIDPAVEDATIKALRWLKDHQEEGGYWMKKNNAEGDAMTGLALLAFLAHNETPVKSEEFGLTVQKAIDYLVRRVETLSDGHLGRAYTHGIVAYALAEAAAMTTGLPEVESATEAALQVILDGQQAEGGFDYRYKKGNRWDLSVASWQLQAMKAATVAGIKMPGLAEAKVKGIDWLKHTTYRNGAFGYSSPGGNRLSMCGAGATVLQMLDEGDSEEVQVTLEQRLFPYQPKWEKVNHSSSYSWYYMTQAIFHGGRRPFKQFFSGFSKMLISHQAEDGHWTEPGKEGKDGIGRDVYMSTALNCLSLQAPFRYLPSYKTTGRQTASRSSGQNDNTLDDDFFNEDDLGIKVK